MQTAIWIVVLLVFLALMFDFINGFHDAANSIATVVSTGVLKPTQAVVFAAVFNFIALFVFQLTVAATIGKGIVMPGVVDIHVVFGALVGAITWNLVTWYYGIPSSSSHALIGGIVGSVLAKSGTSALMLAGVMKTVVFIFCLALAWLFTGLIDDADRQLGVCAFHPVSGRPMVQALATGVCRCLQLGARRQ